MSRKPFLPDRRGLPAVFTYSAALAAGVSAERLYAYRRERLVDQIGRGLYRWASEPEIDHDLLELAYRVPQATLCLITALARHGLSDVIPRRIDVALPRGRRIPKLSAAVDFHVFAADTFGLGHESLAIGGGLTVGLYSAERSLIDVIRLRHREGAEVAWEALRRWLARKGSRPAALIALARRFHGAERAVRQALEVVL